MDLMLGLDCCVMALTYMSWPKHFQVLRIVLCSGLEDAQ